MLFTPLTYTYTRVSYIFITKLFFILHMHVHFYNRIKVRTIPLGSDDFLNALGEDDFTIAANFFLVIVPSYCPQRTTPFPYEIATIKFTLTPPSFFHLAEQFNFNPSALFLHSRAHGARRLVVRVLFVLKSFPI